MDCHRTLVDRRSAKCSMPAPTVAFVSRSITMKPPRSRLSAYGVNGTGVSTWMLATPISLSRNVFAATCVPVSTSSRYFGVSTVIPTVRAPNFAR
jgi:hypothetical protein